ncbi:helix-turn-helix transcriptional regulator [Thiocystis violacea]|uniref:helix-turn-helix transcriptional regulator n=1 Tax=Thiocystis violacea TaxID=13725 RepID=UPI001906AFFE|nr:WYL domain-containing protein [Thiocystis violacea]MBK1725168.1 WYL domain-containing protein [Thiocystis violacea]
MKKTSEPRHLERIERLRHLLQCLPLHVPKEAYPSTTQLVGRVADVYAAASEGALRRAVQRDLDALVQQQRIAVVNPGGKPLRYRRLPSDAEDEDPAIEEWTLKAIQMLAAEALPHRRLDRLWRTLLTNTQAPRLDESRLRVVSDTLRLQPADLYQGVLSAVIQALIQRCALRVGYVKTSGERSDPVLHPQALVQRGPIAYLLALKHDEDPPAHVYALHRMVVAEVLTETPARQVEGFDLDGAIAEGRIDFGQGALIDLELRVRGYLADLLRTCPMEPNQRLDDEPEGSDFDLRLWARVPSTGQLLRWLLGAGDNLEVVGPPDLRRIVAAQARKAAALYGGR